jgi:SAM-dependent methyltransferase
MDSRINELEKIASDYHLNDDVKDKFIEDLCQIYCADWMQSVIRKDQKVIELGYGEGITLEILSKYTDDYTVIEGSPSLIKEIHKKHPKVKVIDSLFEDYAPKEKFDLILALHVFEHVDDPVLLGKHLRSWLKDGGEILTIVPNKNSLHRRLAYNMGLISRLDELSQRDILVGHQRVYDITTLSKDLSLSGFQPFETKGFFLKLLPNSMMLDFSNDLINALNSEGSKLDPDLLANIAIRAKAI